MPEAVSLEKAALYERYRLPYPAEMVVDLLSQIGEVQTIADIGAGTSQLARLFANRSAKVYAVEPDPAMRQVASTALAAFGKVEIRAGFAEHTGLSENS